MRKIISIVLSFGLLFQQSGLVYAVGELNLANYLSQARSAIAQPDQFRPAQLRYISYDIKSNDFKLLLDKGGAKLNELSNSLNSSTPKLNDATQELFNYFLIGLALPNDTFWVNLRPDAPENIIDPLLEKTDIGKIFLEADLQLKKDTASLTSPQNPEGKSYWDKLYKKAGELFGTENITIPTITRPWIVPNEVIVRETEDSAYIYKATLKVMLEADYLNGRGGSRTSPTPDQYAFSDPRLKELNEYSSQIIRETIIPKLTKEINSSKRYAQLRQVYYSLVLSRWFKQKYQGLPVGNGLKPLPTLDSGDLTNLASQEPCDKQAYFQAYQKSFKDGEYHLKETVSTPFGQSIRSYISGGIVVKINDPSILRVNRPEKEVIRTLTGQRAAIVNSPLEFDRVLNDINKIGWDVMGNWRYISEIQFSSKSEREKTELIKGIYGQDKDKFQTIARDYYRQLVIIILKGLEGKEFARVESIFRENISKYPSLKIGFENAADKTKFIKQMLYNIANALYANNYIEDYKLLLLVDVAYSYIHNPESEETFFTVSPLTVEQEELINEIKVATSGHKFKSVPEEILYRIESIIERIDKKVKIEAKDMDTPIKDWIGVDSYDRVIFFNFLEKYFEIDLGETAEDVEKILGKSVNEIVKDLRRRMSDANGGEFKGLLKLICRFGVVDLLKKVPDAVYPDEINNDINGDKIYDAALKLWKIFLNRGDQNNADACNLIRNAWRSVTAGSPLTLEIIDNEVKVKIGNIKYAIKMFPSEARKFIEQPRNNKFKEELEEIYQETDRKITQSREANNIIKASEAIREFYATVAGIQFQESSIALKVSKKLVELEEGESIINTVVKKMKDLIKADRMKFDINEDFAYMDSQIHNLIPNNLKFVAMLMKNSFTNLKPPDYAKYEEKWSRVMMELAIFDINEIGSPLTGSRSSRSEHPSGSSSLEQVNKIAAEVLGGIDLTDRMLKIKLERVGSFASSALILPEINNVEALDLDKEYEQIQAMASSSIRPSDTRILEFAAACYYRGEFDQRLAQVNSCIKSAHLADEISGRDSSPALRLATMLPDALYGG